MRWAGWAWARRGLFYSKLNGAQEIRECNIPNTHTGSLELTTYMYSAMITGQDWSTAWKIP
mgnify:CR=1 FL=1